MSRLPSEPDEIVATLYRALLKREPDPGAAGYIQGIATGAIGESDLARSLMASPEYLSLVQRGVHFASVDTLRWLDLDFRVPPDPHLANEFSSAEGYEPWVFPLFLASCHDTSRVLDVGASIGAYALPAARKAHAGHVFAVEVSQQNCRLLLDSIALNGLSNVSVLPLGASDTLGYASLPRQVKTNNNVIAMPQGGRIHGADTHDVVPLVPIDLLAPSLGRIDIIKMDVEGFKYRVVKGAQGLIANHRPLIFLEYSPVFQQRGSGVDGRDLLNLLSGFGYAFDILHRDSAIEAVDRNSNERIDEAFELHVRDAGGSHLDLRARPT